MRLNNSLDVDCIPQSIWKSNVCAGFRLSKANWSVSSTSEVVILIPSQLFANKFLTYHLTSNAINPKFSSGISTAREK